MEAVGEQQSSRPGFGAVPLYTLSSADEPGKRYDRYDFASYSLQRCGGGVSGARCAATAAL